MSSGSRQDFNLQRGLVSNAPLTQANKRIARLGLTQRQRELMHYWSWYRCERYAARKVAWDGSLYEDAVSIEAVASQTEVPPGFVDVGEQWPLKFRRPEAPYALIRVVVDRFSGFLFSERHHPRIRVEGDPETEDFINALVEASGLWPEMMQARTYGGAMGLVYVGFKYEEGLPEVEVHNPIWCFPEFQNRTKLTLRSLEIRYQYPEERLDEEGIPITVWYWYRRVINQKSDILFAPAQVGDGDEPDWQIAAQVDHDFGFCPVVLIQNLPMQEDVEGDTDYQGICELVETIDQVLSQVKTGIIANCDPTLVLTGGEKAGELQKGSDNAIEGPEGSEAKYLEITGSGPEAGRDFVKELRELALEVSQCVVENPSKTFATATEVERVYSAMLAKVGRLREQYGQKGVVLLIKMMVAAARKLTTARKVDPTTGRPVVQELRLPPRYETDPKTKRTTVTPRRLGPGGLVKLLWPKYFEPSVQETLTATQSAVSGLAGGVIDDETAGAYVGEYFRVEDVPAMIARIREKAQQEQAALDRASLGQVSPMLNTLRGRSNGAPAE